MDNAVDSKVTLESGRELTILGQQGLCIYAKDKNGTLWYRIPPNEEWKIVANTFGIAR